MFKKTPEKGSVREIIAIALPMVVSFSCDTIMIFTDRLFLAKLGPVLMNATMAGGLSAWMMMGFVLGLTGYTTALAAQYLGAGEKKNCPKVLTQAVLMILAAYPVLVLCRPLAHFFFQFMQIAPDQIGPQIKYFDILVLGSIFALLRHVLSSFFSGIGRTGITMVASITAMVVNVVLDYVLIYGKFGFPAMGISGAAYASVIGSVCGVLILVFRYLSSKIEPDFEVHRSFSFHPEIMKKLWHFGYPPGLEMFLNILGFNTMVLLFHATSAMGATASTVVFNWDMVSFVPLMGVEVGVTSLVGRYMGASDPKLAHRSVMSGMKFGFCYSAIIFILFVAFPEPLVHLFDPGDIDRELFMSSIPLAIWMLRMASLYVFLQVVMVTLVGALRGAGDTLWAMWMMVSTHWIMVALLWIELKIFGLPVEAGWITLIVVFFIFSAFVFKRYASGKWQQIRVVE